MALDQLLIEARNARLKDNYDTAIALCNAFLIAHPDDPEGESLLGLCEVETNLPGGEKRIEGAAARNPRSHTILLNLSSLRERQGDLKSAIQSANSAALRAPATFECWAQLGKLLGKAEKFEESLAALEQALKIKPDHMIVLSLLSVAALECEDFDRCEAILQTVEAAAPKIETIRLRAHLETKRGRWSDLHSVAAEWLKLDPSSEEARLGLAHALAQQGYFNEAMTVYAPLCAKKNPEARHVAAMGRYLLGARRLEEARDWFANALENDPRCAEAAYGIARLNHFSGDVAETEIWCRRALSIEPGHADAFGLLAESAKGPAAQNDLAAVELALAAPRLRGSKKISLLFAKGDFLHALKRADDAFGAWSMANELKADQARVSGKDYDPEAHEGTISNLIRLFPDSKSTIALPRNSDDAATPIFIVGMPRSGTTLLEAAISAHPDVKAAGEVPAMPFILSEFLDWARKENWAGGVIPQEKCGEWRDIYLKQARRFGATGALYFTDKQPSNIIGAAFISRLFPSARLIYLRRNPVETAFSIYRRNFTSQWPFSTRLESIAHYYAEHCRIADHWMSAMPDRIKLVQYEDFVLRFEPVLREIVEFCGLSWSDRCLNYFEGERSIITFSAAQVRKPPSKSHIKSTGPYMSRLCGLTEALSQLGVDLVTGARANKEISNL